MIRQYTFLDYIMGGTEMNLMVAIDYTASNGDPKSPDSLHYINPNGGMNQYAQVISAVGNILLSYDSDGKIPTFGFGAKLGDGQVSHCFNVNGTVNPEVIGIEGIIQSYYNSFSGIKLYGPTNFAPVIEVASQYASNMHNSEEDVQAYLILLILTDGEITDMQDTVQQIVDSSFLPMSIVIVGIGGADFGKMNFLDGDTNTLRYGHKVAERDIVQFVPYRDFAGNLQALTASTLAEIPQQFLQYMKKKNIRPRPPLSDDELRAMEMQRINSLQLQVQPIQGQPMPGIQPGQPMQGQPQPGQYGQPQPGQYGQPQIGQYGQPQPGQYGQPQIGQGGQYGGQMGGQRR